MCIDKYLELSVGTFIIQKMFSFQRHFSTTNVRKKYPFYKNKLESQTSF